MSPFVRSRPPSWQVWQCPLITIIPRDQENRVHSTSAIVYSVHLALTDPTRKREWRGCRHQWCALLKSEIGIIYTDRGEWMGEFRAKFLEEKNYIFGRTWSTIYFKKRRNSMFLQNQSLEDTYIDVAFVMLAVSQNCSREVCSIYLFLHRVQYARLLKWQ